MPPAYRAPDFPPALLLFNFFLSLWETKVFLIVFLFQGGYNKLFIFFVMARSPTVPPYQTSTTSTSQEGLRRGGASCSRGGGGGGGEERRGSSQIRSTHHYVGLFYIRNIFKGLKQKNRRRTENAGVSGVGGCMLFERPSVQLSVLSMFIVLLYYHDYE